MSANLNKSIFFRTFCFYKKYINNNCNFCYFFEIFTRYLLILTGKVISYYHPQFSLMRSMVYEKICEVTYIVRSEFRRKEGELAQTVASVWHIGPAVRAGGGGEGLRNLYGFAESRYRVVWDFFGP